MSSAARTAPTHASPITPAATGTAPSASGRPPRRGLRRAKPSCCRCRTSTWCSRCQPQISAIAYQNKAKVYGLLFTAAAETLTTIAADPKHLGADIGVTAVLHSWGQNLHHHPHVHCIVPGGGISPDGKRWIACKPGFFLPVRVLSRLFRRLFLRGPRSHACCGRAAILCRSRQSQRARARLRPLSRRCARPNGSSMPKNPSPAPSRSWPISRATRIASRSPTAA